MIIRLTDKINADPYGDVVHYFCKNCGCEMYAELHVLKDSSSLVRNIEKSHKRADLFMKMELCPHCRHELDYTAGYYFYTYGSFGNYVEENRQWLSDKDYIKHGWSLEANFEHMKKLRDSQQKQSAEKAVTELCEKFTPVNVSGVIGFGIDEVKSNNSKLKEYLHNIIKTEASVHSLSKRLEALYIQRIANNRQNEYEKYSYVRRMDKPLEKAQKKYQKCLDQYTKAKNQKPEKVSIGMPIKPTPPILEKAGLFNKKKVLEKNELLTAQYEEELREYNKEVQFCEQEKIRIEQENAEKLAQIVANAYEKMEEAKKELEQAKSDADKCADVPEQVMAPLLYSKSIIEKEIEEAEELLRKMIECRSKLYGYNVIFPKYQNWIAITTFYEYLMAGRCDMLEGTNGAYNLYETEIRANLVISQLSQIIESLEQVKANQYMLYSELKNINQNMETLNSSMSSALQTLNNISQNTEKMGTSLENISQNTDVIAHNTAVTAYYSKMNAELTNSLGYLVAFK